MRKNIISSFFLILILFFGADSWAWMANSEFWHTITLQLIAGHLGGYGTIDGTATAARFNVPYGMVFDSSGNLFVADSGNDTIRKITPTGVVTTFAGTAGVSGTTDGTGVAALFNAPKYLAIDASNNLYVTDYSNHSIRKITSSAVVTTFAGTAGTSGSTDGTGTAAKFKFPSGIVYDNFSGLIYVSDSSNDTIRAITSAAVVTTFAGTAGSTGSTNATGTSARFNNPRGLTVDLSGNLYVTDANNDLIRKVTSAAVVTTFAGTAGSAGVTNGTGTAAKFSLPQGIVLDSVSGNLYVADTGNDTVRQITMAAVVTTVAGHGIAAFSNGTGTAIGFSNNAAITSDSSGNLYVTDSFNVVRKMTNSFVASNFAGSPLGSGYADGTGSAASFQGTSRMTAADDLGTVFVADGSNNVIRKITSGGVVTTFAGSSTSGSTDATGTAATFNSPGAVVMDSSGNLFVSDTNNSTIRKITPSAVVTTFAGTAGSTGSTDGTGTAARFYFPNGLAVDSSDNLYVADTSNQTIRKITPAGVVTTLAGMAGTSGNTNGTGTAASFFSPRAVAVDSSNNIYVADSGNYVVRKITPTGVVTTFAGTAGSSGLVNATGTAAKFGGLIDITIDSAGDLYVADNFNDVVRKVTSAAVVTTPVGISGSVGVALHRVPTSLGAVYSVSVRKNNLYILSESAVLQCQLP